MSILDRRRRKRRQQRFTVSTLGFFCWCLLFFGKKTSAAFGVARPYSRYSRVYSSSANNNHHDNEGDGIGIGIDLGTTYSAVAILQDDGVPTIIPVANNGRTMPSVAVCCLDDGTTNASKWLVGKEACAREVQCGGAYRNVKRVLGTGGKLAPDIAKVVPFVVPSKVGKTFKRDSLLNRIHDATEHPTLLKRQQSCALNETTTIQPEQVSAEILKTLVHTAEQATGKSVTRAVIGVPAYFHDIQREATQRAAQLAGIPKVKLLREPEAAALAYGIGKKQISGVLKNDDEEELVLVFDLGGGTFDVSILLVGGGLTEIISTSGNAQLGGADFDWMVAQYCWKLLKSVGGVVATTQWPREANDAIVRAAEQIRIHLSNHKRVHLALPLSPEEWSNFGTGKEVILSPDDEVSEIPSATVNETHVLCTLSRREMELLCKDELQALLRPIREVAIMAGALLPGDASPAAVEAAMEEEYYEQQQHAAAPQASFGDFYAHDDENNDEETANIDSGMLLELQEMDMKAAKKAQQRGRKKARNVSKRERKYRQEKRKLEKTKQNVQMGERVKIRDGISGRPISRVVLVGGATRMPAIGRLIGAVTGVVPQRTVNPDEAVALGCAVHVGVLDGMEGMGTVLNPMQAAILKAVAEQQGIFVDDSADDEDFEDVDYF